MLLLVILIIALALAFDFVNGFHDAANSVATVVSTRVLSPRVAVVWAAFFNFIAFLFFGLHVAATIGKGIIDPHIVDPVVVAAALSGAVAPHGGRMGGLLQFHRLPFLRPARGGHHRQGDH